eukprot:TRINITY_DN2211_c0_g1_i1.p1 TRINITY_DN2211_c0_g1~~TRINITY_DN2211_c0_g1_i1.p1  ORF type:complete len:187 (-),score=36.58 TRINITY_DN2211_c0_g1_i1:338-898(-)
MFGGWRTAMLGRIASVYLKRLFEAVAWTATGAAAFAVYAVATEAVGALDTAAKCVQMLQGAQMLEARIGHVGAALDFEILQVVQPLEIRNTIICESNAIREIQRDELGERRDALQTVIGDLRAAVEIELLQLLQLDKMLQPIIRNTDAHFEREELEIESFEVLQRVGADLRTEAQIEILEGLFDMR